VLFEGALKCGVATMKIILDGVVATTTSLGDVKCHRSIVTHQNLGKTLAKMVWALETLDLLMALIS
jgi:hypothetical protein